MEVALEGVHVHRGGRLVLDVPALTIPSGSITAILGPNGAGKSTLLRTIAALERPTAGTVSLGSSPARPDRATRALVAYAFQHAIFLSGTLRSNFDLALRLRGVPREERESRIHSVAAACGVAHVVDRDARTLSGGEAQRGSLARALMLQAPITLLDEPLAGLDAPSREQLLRDLPALLEDAAGTVVIVTHDRDEAARLATDVVLLIDGKMHAAGPLRDVFSRPPDPPSAAFLGWTVAPADGGILAIAPGSLRPGHGEVELQFLVRQLIDLDSRWEAIGEIAGSPARLSGSAGAPAAGSSLLVSAPRAAVVHYDARKNERDSIAQQ